MNRSNMWVQGQNACSVFRKWFFCGKDLNQTSTTELQQHETMNSSLLLTHSLFVSLYQWSHKCWTGNIFCFLLTTLPLRPENQVTLSFARNKTSSGRTVAGWKFTENETQFGAAYRNTPPPSWVANTTGVNGLAEFTQINSDVFWYEIKPGSHGSHRIKMFPVSSVSFWIINSEM